MRILHPCYQTKTIGHILKNKQKSKRACIHMTSHNENEYENEKKITYIQDKYRPRSRHGDKFSKC